MAVNEIRGGGDRCCFMERRGDGVAIIRRETLDLCGKLPEYRVIDDVEVALVIPVANHEPSAGRPVIWARSGGIPLAGVDLLIPYPDKTWKHVITSEAGEAGVELHTTHLPMTVFASAPGHAAHLERGWIPSRRALALELALLPQGGSVILPESGGSIPGLRGSINPIRDTRDRTCLYASNIAINGGRQQPVHFLPGEELRLTDSEGGDLCVRIIDIVGRSTLVEYYAPPV